MLSYFVHLQSITDNQTVAKAPSVSQGLDSGKQHKDICTNHGQSGLLSFPFQSGQADIDCISSKSKTYSQGPFAVYQGPCPVHPMSSHTWGELDKVLKSPQKVLVSLLLVFMEYGQYQLNCSEKRKKSNHFVHG